MAKRMDPKLLMLRGAVLEANCVEEFERALASLRTLEDEAKATGEKAEAAFWLALGYYGQEKSLES